MAKCLLTELALKEKDIAVINYLGLLEIIKKGKIALLHAPMRHFMVYFPRH